MLNSFVIYQSEFRIQNELFNLHKKYRILFLALFDWLISNVCTCSSMWERKNNKIRIDFILLRPFTTLQNVTGTLRSLFLCHQPCSLVTIMPHRHSIFIDKHCSLSFRRTVYYHTATFEFIRGPSIYHLGVKRLGFKSIQRESKADI